MTDRSPLLLGVDAGGTKSRALAATAGPGGRFCLHGVGEAGPGNPMSHGLERAAGSIVSAIRAALSAAGAQQPEPAMAVVAAAGAADDTLRRALQQALDAANVAATCRVVPDYEPFFSLAAPPVVGVIAGTGSVAFARGADADVVRVGGWGYLLGDEGSGYAIGREALRAALAELELGRSLSPMAQACLAALQASDRAGLLAAVYKSDDQRGRIAGVARRIVELARTDQQAAALLQAEAVRLAGVVHQAVTAAGLGAGRYSLSVGGGILVGSAEFRATLIESLCDRQSGPAEVVVVRDPAVGCLAAAHGLLG